HGSSRRRGARCSDASPTACSIMAGWAGEIKFFFLLYFFFLDFFFFPTSRGFVGALPGAGGGPSMSSVLSEGRGGAGESDGLDAEAFAWDLRQFVAEAHRILGRPGSSLDDLLALHRRAWSLLRGAPGAPSSEMRRWLLAVRAAIDDRLRSWPLEEPEWLEA